MGKLLVGLDEITEGKAKARDKVLKLVLTGEVDAFIAVDEPYSVIQGYEGERIKKPEDYGLYAPVKQEAVKAFQVDQDVIKDIINLGQAKCLYFDIGVGFDDQGTPIKYATVTRNYIPFVKESFHCYESKEDIERDKAFLSSGGVYEEDKLKCKVELRYFYKEKLPVNNFSGALLKSVYSESYLAGFNSFSNQMIRTLLACTSLYEFDPGVEIKPFFEFYSSSLAGFGACHQSISWCFRNGGRFFAAYHLRVMYEQWRAEKYIEKWINYEVFRVPHESLSSRCESDSSMPSGSINEDVFLCSSSRYKYGLCHILGGWIEVEKAAALFTVPYPEKITITASDLFFLAGDEQVLLSAVPKAKAKAKAKAKTYVDANTGDNAAKCYLDIQLDHDYKKCKKIAIQWICDEAGIEEGDLLGEERLIEFATLAVWIWDKTPDGKKVDRAYSKKLVDGFEKSLPSYRDRLESMIVLVFRKTPGAASSNGVSMQKKERQWEKSGVTPLIKAWKKYVFDRSMTARRQRYSKWTSEVKIFLEREHVKNHYFTAVKDVILSDEKKERMFDPVNNSV